LAPGKSPRRTRPPMADKTVRGSERRGALKAPNSKRQTQEKLQIPSAKLQRSPKIQGESKIHARRLLFPLPWYVFSAPTKRGRSAALRPLHRPPIPGARENPQRHRDCATRKRRKRRAPFPRATTTVNTYRGEEKGNHAPASDGAGPREWLSTPFHK